MGVNDIVTKQQLLDAIEAAGEEAPVRLKPVGDGDPDGGDGGGDGGGGDGAEAGAEQAGAEADAEAGAGAGAEAGAEDGDPAPAEET